MKTYELSYDGDLLAIVEIDHAIADQHIKEMVEFWSNWESDLEDFDGDYTQVWFKNLALHILDFRWFPKDEEGWCDLDGTYGIKVTKCWRYQFNPDLIEVTQS